MILTLPDCAERRRIAKKMHKTKDKDHCRRLNAILLFHKGIPLPLYRKFISVCPSKPLLMVDLHQTVGGFQLDMVANQLMGNRVVVTAIFNVIIRPNFGSLGFGIEISLLRKWL